jgi:hypothetical protein
MAATSSKTDVAGKPLLFGVSLNQVDELNRLLGVITAMGNVFATGNAGLMREEGLVVLGDVIFDSACEVRGILDEVYGQRLRKPK